MSPDSSTTSRPRSLEPSRIGNVQVRGSMPGDVDYTS